MPKCKACDQTATQTVNTKTSKGSMFAFRCDSHLDQKLAEMKALNKIGTYGPICVPCSGTGIQPKFKHVRGGVCFRCSGTGIMGDKKELK